MCKGYYVFSISLPTLYENERILEMGALLFISQKSWMLEAEVGNSSGGIMGLSTTLIVLGVVRKWDPLRPMDTMLLMT